MAYNQQPYYNGGYYPQYQNGAMPDMLNQYKGPYQQFPQISQPIPQQIQQTIQPVPTSPKSNNDIIWVQGEAGAKGYLVAPSNTVVLWDTENPTIYVKSADGNGIPSMRVLDFTERKCNIAQTAETGEKEHVCQCGEKFITKEVFNDLKEKFEALQAKCDELMKPIEQTKTKTTKKGDVE